MTNLHFPPFICRRQVEFSETDMAGIVHFANYYRWMEMAEGAFLESCGLSLVTKKEEFFFGFPRVKANCEFKAPLRFKDTVNIQLTVEKVHNHSIDYQFHFYKEEGGDKKTLSAIGTMTCVYARFEIKTGVIEPKLLPENFKEILNRGDSKGQIKTES